MYGQNIQWRHSIRGSTPHHNVCMLVYINIKICSRSSIITFCCCLRRERLAWQCLLANARCFYMCLLFVHRQEKRCSFGAQCKWQKRRIRKKEEKTKKKSTPTWVWFKCSVCDYSNVVQKRKKYVLKTNVNISRNVLNWRIYIHTQNGLFFFWENLYLRIQNLFLLLPYLKRALSSIRRNVFTRIREKSNRYEVRNGKKIDGKMCKYMALFSEINISSSMRKQLFK